MGPGGVQCARAGGRVALTRRGGWEEKRPKVKRPLSSSASHSDGLYAYSETRRKDPFSALNAGFVKRTLNMGRWGAERCVLDETFRLQQIIKITSPLSGILAITCNYK